MPRASPAALAVGGETGHGPGERAFGRLVAAVQARTDAGIARPGDARLTAVNTWVALHGIISLRTIRPAGHPWPSVETPVDAALVGQAGLDHAT